MLAQHAFFTYAKFFPKITVYRDSHNGDVNGLMVGEGLYSCNRADTFKAFSGRTDPNKDRARESKRVDRWAKKERQIGGR